MGALSCCRNVVFLFLDTTPTISAGSGQRADWGTISLGDSNLASVGPRPGGGKQFLLGHGIGQRDSGSALVQGGESIASALQIAISLHRLLRFRFEHATATRWSDCLVFFIGGGLIYKTICVVVGCFEEQGSWGFVGGRREERGERRGWFQA